MLTQTAPSENDLVPLKTLSHQEANAMNISLAVGVGMLFLKWFAYWLTGSAAIFSDASETFVHIIAVGFAAYSLRVAHRPPDSDHHYGHDKISYFSAGFEGGLIIIAAIVIIYTAIQKLILGIQLESLGVGATLIAVAAAINTVLGLYLVRTGKKHSSLILLANGRHLLTDAWTSGGAIIALVLVLFTGVLWLDPAIAIFTALNIIYEGGKLVHRAGRGLMDAASPDLEAKAMQTLSLFCEKHGLTFHKLRLRESGTHVYVDFHLQFSDETSIEKAHELATEVERMIAQTLEKPADVISHLESFSSEGIDGISHSGKAG